MDPVNSNINWDDVLKKEARGLDDADFGEVHEVEDDFVLTQKGVVHKDKFSLPKSLVTRFDGHKLWFNITKDESDKYKNIHDDNLSENATKTITDTDDITINKNIDYQEQNKGNTNGGYLNRDDKYPSREQVSKDINDVTDKSISHRGQYQDNVNDPELPRNTITTDDNFNNRVIDESALITDNDLERQKIKVDETIDANTEYKGNMNKDTIISNSRPTFDSNINWDDVLKKEARGLDDADFGEVHEVEDDFVLTQKGVVHKDKFSLPKSLVTRFDGHKLWFNITKDESDKYKRD